MAAGDGSKEPSENGQSHQVSPSRPEVMKPPKTADESEDEPDEQDEEDEEPRLKYATLTRNVSPLYRNGDATSTFLVAGDKMVS